MNEKEHSMYQSRPAAVATAAVGFAFASIVAGAATFDGTGDWPTGGDVELVATVQVDDTHVAAVAGWQTLTIASGCRLNFVNTGTAATLAATVSGAGKIGAVDSVGLTISGDNRNFAGGCAFTNSAVTVANEYGLGGPSTAAADVYFTKTGTLGALDFQWAGQTAFTNHCSLTFACAENYTGTKAMYLGSLSADTYFVQDADFTFATANAAKRYLKFRGNTEFISGKFRSTVTSVSLYSSADPGATITFSGTAKICIGGENTNNSNVQDWFLLGQSAAYTFGHTGGTHARAIALNVGAVVLAGDGLFTDYLATGEQYGCNTWQSYTVNQSGYKNRFDLNGHDVVFHRFATANNTVKDGTTNYHIITSSEPAAVSLVGDGNGVDNTNVAAPEFQGKASLTVDNNITNRLATRVSSPDGTLSVKSGVLVYQWNGGWDGTAVRIEGGAIVANSARAFSGGHSALTMTGGKMVLSSAYPVMFSTATIGGNELEPDSYTLAALRDVHGLGEYFEGDDDAVFSVLGASGVWTGWPTTAGATAQVPQDATVFITDGDVANVAGLGKIMLGAGSTVVCSGLTQWLNISAAVSGYGTFRIVDSAGVTLLGDNSKLISPGHFDIANSYVAVSNRCGLGSTKTAAASVSFSTRDRPLVFGLADGSVFTNNVGISVSQTSASSTQIAFGTDSKDQWLVQNGDFTTSVNGNYSNRIMIRGSVEFAKSFLAPNSQSYCFNGDSGGSIKFGRNARISGKNNSLSFLAYLPDRRASEGYGTGRFVFACTNQTGLTALGINIADLVFEADNVVGAPGETATILNYFNNAASAWYYMSVIDLNGHDQAFDRFASQTDRINKPGDAGKYAIVTSAVPATLTISSTQALNRWEVLKFRGAAGFAYAGVGTNLFVDVASDTTGDFRVSSGVAGFDWGATWAGTNIVVDGTGVLYVGAESAPAFGTKAAAKASGVTLRVRDGGKLYLESGETFVYEACRGGEKVPRGEWSTANCDWIEGGGTLRVLHDGMGLMMLIR